MVVVYYAFGWHGNSTSATPALAKHISFLLAVKAAVCNCEEA